jgi:hypothetical protein
MSNTSRLSVALAVSITMPGSILAQDTLRIMTPAEGTIVNPGGTVVVYVTASGGPFKSVSIGAPDPIKGSQLLTTAPYQFGITIPATTTPGLYPLTALGNTNAGTLIMSDPIMIDVERPDSPQNVTTDGTQLELAVGDRTVIPVAGTYADGSNVDLHKSTQTRYDARPPGVISVSRDGQVTALKARVVTLTVEHKQKTAVVKVFVAPGPK